MVRSGARSVFEDLAFTLGSDILRCGSCGGRFLSFLKFNIPARSHGAVQSRGDGFMVDLNDRGFVGFFSGQNGEQ